MEQRCWWCGHSKEKHKPTPQGYSYCLVTDCLCEEYE